MPNLLPGYGIQEDTTKYCTFEMVHPCNKDVLSYPTTILYGYSGLRLTIGYVIIPHNCFRKNIVATYMVALNIDTNQMDIHFYLQMLLI